MPFEKDPAASPDSLSGLTVEQAMVVLDALSLPTKLEIEERKIREAEKAKQGDGGFIPFIG